MPTFPILHQRSIQKIKTYVEDSVNNTAESLHQYIDTSIYGVTESLHDYVDNSIGEATESIEQYVNNELSDLEDTMNNREAIFINPSDPVTVNQMAITLNIDQPMMRKVYDTALKWANGEQYTPIVVKAKLTSAGVDVFFWVTLSQVYYESNYIRMGGPMSMVASVTPVVYIIAREDSVGNAVISGYIQN